jgi:DNA (cytosine-5)-methyltransferase 1
VFQHGFRTHPATAAYRNPALDHAAVPGASTVVSLFAGCGGLDLGFLGGFSYLGQVYRAHPFQIVHAVDVEERAVESYRLNLGEHAVTGDLTEVPSTELPRGRVLIGGFPCQDFSSSGPKVGFAGSRGTLYRVLVDYMVAHQPDIVVGENVPHLRGLRQGRYLETIVRDFEACGYEFEVWEIVCPDYGLSQSRRRLFFVGRRTGLRGFPEKPLPTHAARHRPIEAAIADLESVTDERVTNQSQYFVATKATSGGGQGDHKNRRGELAYCIRANAKARIQFHYQLDRRLTVRECARLQSFPDEFVFPFAAMTNMSHIGNAVPPIVGHHVAGAVAEYLRQLDAGTAVTERPREQRVRQHELFSLNVAGLE